MSNEVFPSTLNGYLWDSKKKPTFNNVTHSPTSGRDIHIALYSQPVFEFNLSNQWLTDADKNTLMNFFQRRQGSFDSFLYADEDSTVTAHAIYVGDGVTTQFQLSKWNDPFREIVNNVAGMPTIYLNGVTNTDWSMNATGLITFTTAPGAGVVISWSGLAYYRCVFLEDALEYNQFASRLYDCEEIAFKGSLVNKL
jgi:uncharacterized protein (TIGR02217 family)